jgi:hypothetical protein
MRDILLGNGSFETLIHGNYLYIDKTKHLYELIRKAGTYYFLSRPRRFGKSLTLSTLEAIFKGKRELFKGLYIDGTDYDWKEYPVVRFDFSTCLRSTADGVADWINRQTIVIARAYGIQLDKEDGFDINLDLLISRLGERGKVVVLIDEYDSILTNNINSDKLEDLRSSLRGFYAILKAQCANIRFCFITGVTKFSKLSIFSGMNNFTDISLDREYATMLGYTQKELEENFSEYIERGISQRKTTRNEYLEEVKAWYDGYRFAPNSETVYNPVSVGFFFTEDSAEFKPYWIDTGGMSFVLTEIAKRVQFDVSLDTELEVSSSKLNGTDFIQMVKTNVSKDNFLSLLYQTGYLTIKGSESVEGNSLITLGYPNKEVKKGLTEILLPLYLGSYSDSFNGDRILKLFSNGKVDEAMSSFYTIYASIPYNELVFNAENACHASFLCMMNLLGAEILAEEPTNIGRIDAVLICRKYIYIIEFKFNQSAEDAICQIRKNRYWEKYRNAGREIHLVGINFSTDKNNIVEWKDEVFDGKVY